MLTIKNTPPDFAELSEKEWLITNGIGGYAASTVTGANTRRYHGLLVAALHPPTRRTLLVSKVEECICFNRDCAIGLSSNQYPGVVHPQGYQYFKFFERKPFPTVKFEAGGNHLLKTVFMAPGSNTTVVEYANTGNTLYKLCLTPLFVYRDYHALSKEDAVHNFWLAPENGSFTLHAHYGAAPLYFNFSAGEFVERRSWYKNFQYAAEQERGLDYEEDCFAVADIVVVLQPGAKVYLLFSTDPAMVKRDPEALKRDALQSLEAKAPARTDDPFLRDLMLAGEQFIVCRESTGGYSLLAGYPWFTDWGRDTMIAMRGLTIATGKREVSRSILDTFFHYLDAGMLPNRFPDAGETPEYNTIDATLWLFVALYEYYLKFNDLEFIGQHIDALTDILDRHIAGTRYGIRVTPEGFLAGGEGLAQLTWMDARVGDYVVTPRHGCPVEIQALWFNALRIYQHFAGALGKPYAAYREIGDRLQANFRQYFRRPDGSLNDVVDTTPGCEFADGSLRPNQIYAVSLPFSLLERADERAVVDVVRRHLLTDFGLRSLSEDHPDFKPVYTGGPWERDTAYHQGTVWPFLLGEYAAALLKTEGWSEKSRKETLALFDGLQRHFYQDHCILGISEVFDGKLPRKGKGAFHQAWSVGAVLKTLLELREGLKKKRPARIPTLVDIRPMIF